MKKFLCVGEPYTNKDGEEKTRWNRIGEMFEAKSGKTFAKLYTMPGVLISLFDDTPKEAKKAVKTSEYGPLAPDEEVPF